MSSRFRSASLGAVPHKKPLSRSRAESSHASPLEVRCACQFFQSDSLIPERVNPIGSRPPSRVGEIEKPIYTSNHNILESTVEEENLSGSVLSFGKASVPDYYADTSNSIRLDANDEAYNYSFNKENEQLSLLSQPLSFDNRSIPSIEIESYRTDYPIMNLTLSSQPQLPPQLPPKLRPKGQFSSQKSLDRYSTSVLLNKYRPKSQSHAPSLQGSSHDIRSVSKMTKTVSFDYGKPSVMTNSHSENLNFDQYHRMSPMVFPIRDRLQKFERMHDSRDHEYEPIGEPLPDENVRDLEQAESQKRKTSDTAIGAEKKFMRTPTEDSEDNISAQDFQNEIENRFFQTGIQPMVDDEAHVVHQENTFEEAVIIDESPVEREVPRKRNFMTSAQEQSKSFHKKIKAQAGIFKTSLNNKMKKKPKEKPVAVEVAQEEELQQTVETFVVEEVETVETIVVQPSEVPAKSKKFSMPKFTKNIKKPSLPSFKKPEMPKISLPERPDLKMGERFSGLRKLGRSKSMKEESAATDSTSFTTPEVTTAEPTKKRFDFGTYPRLIRDKFKRPKIPERSDQSVRSETPPVEFTKENNTFLQRGPVASRWPEYDQDSGKYQQFNSESDLDRESSIERRMRLDYERSTEEREDFEIVKRLMNEEQRQLDEMDRENLEIHLMAQQEKFKKPVERQESDTADDEDKLLWSGMLNKDLSKDDSEEPNALKFGDDYKFSLDQYKTDPDINRSYTPQTNQETQSSGSSGTRRRKGVFDDEDEYFLRENRISNEIHIGDYISSAIKEGLSSPEDNALMQMGNFDEYVGEGNQELIPDKPIRSLKRKNKKSRDDEEEDGEGNDNEPWQHENVGRFNDFYKTFPPGRPARKERKSLCEDEDLGVEIDLSEDHQVPDSCNDADDLTDSNERELFYQQRNLKRLEHPELILDRDDFDNDMDFHPLNLPIPPTPPRRRKKKIRSVQPVVNLRNTGGKLALGDHNVIVQRYEQKFVPLAAEERYTTPTPPRRTRSRSQVSAHTLDDADSFRNDSVEAFTVFNVQDKENGYAQVRKELPSRPVRRKRSTKSLGERQFATMPHMKRDEVTPPPRPTRNYSTIIPNKPPRRKSAGSLVEISQTNQIDDDDYEEIVDQNHENIASQRLKSGEIVKKMKDRPLPPPPRPKREPKKPKKDDEEDDNKFDKDDAAERIIEPLTIETSNLNLLGNELLTGTEILTKESLPRQNSDFSEPEKVVEVEVSTQTDPVPDEEFVCDEDDEDIDIDEFLASDGKMKTLEDILKEEQEAEMERARQLAEAENLSRGIQRFRDSSQRSMSERSRTSGDRSRSLSRPITPSAVIVERKKSSPIIFNNQEQTLTEAGLFIHPITYDDYGLQVNEENREELVDEAVVGQIDVNNNLETERNQVEVQTVPDEGIHVEERHVVGEIINVEVNPVVGERLLTEVIPSTNEQTSSKALRFTTDLDESSDEFEKIVESAIEDDALDPEFDAEMQRKIEEMIESVISSAREEVDWLNQSNKDIEDEEPIVESVVTVEISKPDLAPVPPPRRKSTAEDSLKTEPKIENLPIIDERQIEQTVEKSEDESEVIEQDMEATRPEETEQVEEAEDEKISSQFPNRLHLSNLEIDNLSVCSLTAGRIVASEIDSNTIVTNELECKTSHNLSNTKSLEFPPGFIEEIVERVRNAERAETQSLARTESSQQPKETSETSSLQTNVENDKAPERPPLPSQFGFSEFTSPVPPTFYQLRDNSGEEAVHPQMPPRRRRHQTKRKDSTSEEDYQRDQRGKGRSSAPGDQSILSLGGQFARACGNALRESGGQLMEILRASSKDDNKRDLHIALIILIIIVAGLILMGMGEKSVHHHHWDFFNPPDNHGR